MTLPSATESVPEAVIREHLAQDERQLDPDDLPKLFTAQCIKLPAYFPLR